MFTQFFPEISHLSETFTSQRCILGRRTRKLEHHATAGAVAF
jgi:hypothetical protein